MEKEDFIIEKREARQGSPRTGKSPKDNSGSFVRARPRTGRFNARGRGRAALPNIGGYSYLKEGGMRFRSRRVIVKVRVIKMRGPNIAKGSRLAYAHLKYLQREGTDIEHSRDDYGRPVETERKARLYGPYGKDLDAKDFLKRGEQSFRGRGDKHQFRLIVSPEDGVDIGDLTPYTRDLMGKMQADLQTRLDWVAVNHYDTAHPHVHIIIRGETDDGKILNIAGDYISGGIRGRAREIATKYLGMKSELEISEERFNEVRAERYTHLDRQLEKINIKHNIVDLTPNGYDLPPNDWDGVNRHVLMGRVKHLRDMGLAHEVEKGRWNLRPDMRSTLKALSERGDIIKSIHRAMNKHGIDRQAVLHNQVLKEAVIGRVIGKGLAGDEMSGRLRLIVDGVDGQVHAVDVGGRTRVGEARIGAIVKIEPYKLRQVDKTILRFCDKGIYSEQTHLTEVIMKLYDKARDHVTAHRRRLKALEAAGIVKEQGVAFWHIPDDFEDKVLAYDRAQNKGSKLTLLSQFNLEQQLASDGCTLLDNMVQGFSSDAWREAGRMQGFGIDLHDAVAYRQAWLIEQKLANVVGGDKVDFLKNFKIILRRREVERLGEQRAAETGKMFKEQYPDMQISGRYTEKLELASGPHAVIETQRAFYLVPWRDVMERYRGRQITGRSLSGSISWELRSRNRGLGR